MIIWFILMCLKIFYLFKDGNFNGDMKSKKDYDKTFIETTGTDIQIQHQGGNMQLSTEGIVLDLSPLKNKRR